uniref:Secreted frizzled-related protein 5 n=1 Tax=Cyanistes caeruleus TaxID=156563 RepID=A0A8C0VR63_CYACU
MPQPPAATPRQDHPHGAVLPAQGALSGELLDAMGQVSLHGQSQRGAEEELGVGVALLGEQGHPTANLLEHETMAEAKQQAGSWVPLLAKQCHTDTQLFLCSLFAPVCLDRPVYPCRSLCEVVRDSCAPVMESYGFPWPEMLQCGKFPSDHELCIAVQFGNSKATPPPVSKICTQCEMEHKADGMMEQMCSSDFVVKMRIKEMTEENGERRLVAAQKKKVLKLGPLKRKDTKKMVLHMRNAGACPCPQLDSLSGSFLVMGRKVGGRLLLLAIYPWQKHNKEMKFAVKFMFSYPCPLYHPLLYGAGQH